jgi:mRNA-degrading endonuclease toxin of MazEF toxin-antitoxin module
MSTTTRKQAAFLRGRRKSSVALVFQIRAVDRLVIADRIGAITDGQLKLERQGRLLFRQKSI